MVGEWSTTALANVAEIIMGQSPPGSTYNETGEGLPFFQGAADFNHRYPTPRVFCTAPSRIAEAGDILFSVRAPIGRVNVANQRCAIGRGLAIIRPHHSTDARYIEFALRYAEPLWQAIEGNGSVFGNATRRDLEHFRIPWPNNEAERSAIAHILGTLDDKIELNRRVSETLEAMVQALFKAWFVNFEPVRAKMEGRWRRGESLPGLPAQLYDLFPNRLVPSELGEIPEGWIIGKLGEVAEYLRRPVRPDKIAPETPYVGLEHMPRQTIMLSHWETTYRPESNKFAFRKGDILFGKLRPYFHKVGVAPIDGVCSTDIIVLAAKEYSWMGFVLGHVSSREFIEYASANANGTKMPRTSWSDVARYKIALPPKVLAEAFNDFVQPLLDSIIANVHSSHMLSALRDILLPKVMSGRLRVKDPDRLLKEYAL